MGVLIGFVSAHEGRGYWCIRCGAFPGVIYTQNYGFVLVQPVLMIYGNKLSRCDFDEGF